MRPVWFLSLLLLVALGVVALAAATGTQGVEPRLAWQAFISGDGMEREVILSLRLPRALAAFGCGALLALAGALLQALLRNPLADPYLLGISGGAGAGILLALMLGLGGLMPGIAGLGGAGLSLVLLMLLAWRDGLRPQRLLLAGVILSTSWGAVVTLLLALAPDAPLRGMVFWLMGDLSGVDPDLAPLPLAGALLALLTAWPLAQGFDALARGELTARALGVPVDRLRMIALALAALAAVLVVLVAGSIGFVGLVAPHLLRLAGLRRHRVLLPGCALGGGILVLAADLAARTLVAPLQLPIGAVTAALGAPVFLWLLARNPR